MKVLNLLKFHLISRFYLCLDKSVSNFCINFVNTHSNYYNKLQYFCFPSNLIQPPGMMLRPAVFDLRVFRAEDIPQSRFYENFVLFANII